jgi:peptide/nickel transport system substrate-binding protein
MRTPNRQLLIAISVMAIIAVLVASCSSPSTPSGVAPTTAAQVTSTTSNSSPTTASTSVSSTNAPAATTSATNTPSAGAATPTTASASSGTVKSPDTMVESSIGDPESLDPAWAYDTASGEVIFNVYETLLFPKKDSTTEYSPMLATKWDISQDGKTYTFTIRQGVKFQDGTPLTPQDVAYSFWRGMIQDRAGGPQWIILQPFFGLDVQSFKDDVVTKQFGGDFTKAAQAVEQAVTFDNTAMTVTMHLKQAYGPMLSLLTGSWASIVSMPWVIKQKGWDGKPETAEKFHDPASEKDELFQTMNGTGPFKLDRWAHGEEVDLVRNDNYWVTTPLWDGGPSGPAKLARVAIKNVKEFGTRFAALKTGDADIAYIDRQYISQVDPLASSICDATTNKCTPTNAQGGILTLYKNQPAVSEDVVFFNQNVNATGGNNNLGSGKLDGNGIPANFFSDINVRKAFNDCFDWDTYIKQIWNGEAIQGFGPILQGELGYDPNQAHFKFDLTQCANDFKASTLKSADGKSLWDTGFFMQYVYNTGNDQRKTAGEILQQNLQQVNPKFNLKLVDETFALLLKDQVAGRMPIFMLGWQEDFHDPQDWVSPFLAGGGTYASSQKFAPDLQKQLDTLINQGVQETNSDARAKIYQQLQNLSYQNALDIFLVQPLSRHYQRSWVQGYYFNPIYPGIYFYPLSKG